MTPEELQYYMSIINSLERLEENIDFSLIILDNKQTVEQALLEKWNLEKYSQKDSEIGILN